MVIKKINNNNSITALPTKKDNGKKNTKKLNRICLLKLKYVILNFKLFNQIKFKIFF